MLALLGQAALRTLLLAAAVQLGLGLLRTKRPQLRLAAWTVVLAASLAVPALQRAAPLRLSVLPNLPGAALAEAADPRRQASAFEASMPWLEALHLLVGGVLLLRLLRRAAPVRLDWAADARVRTSRGIVAPVTVANTILLPSDAVNWPAAVRKAVSAHERAHVARWDFAMLLASQVNRAVSWFSPLSWWLHRRLAAPRSAQRRRTRHRRRGRPGWSGALFPTNGPAARGRTAFAQARR